MKVMILIRKHEKETIKNRSRILATIIKLYQNKETLPN
jgi:hypothetical protein